MTRCTPDRGFGGRGTGFKMALQRWPMLSGIESMSILMLFSWLRGIGGGDALARRRRRGPWCRGRQSLCWRTVCGGRLRDSTPCTNWTHQRRGWHPCRSLGVASGADTQGNGAHHRPKLLRISPQSTPTPQCSLLVLGRFYEGQGMPQNRPFVPHLLSIVVL